MRTLLPIVALVLLAAAPAPMRRTAATPVVNPLGAAKGCPETPMSLARKSAEKPQLRRLDRLPPAHVFRAVDHRVSGCPMPITLTGRTLGR
jgi:hypothetical protein